MTQIVTAGVAARAGLLAALGLSLAGCLPSAEPGWLLDPADPTLGQRPPRYDGVTRGVKRFGVVEPKDWRALNRAVGPDGGPSMPGMDMGPRRDTGGRR